MNNVVISLHQHEIRLFRDDVQFPIELRQPDGFAPERPKTWPKVEGRVEYLKGKLLYMPPCGDIQQDVVGDVFFALKQWTQDHPQFLAATNEAGMMLGGDVRGADAAVWRRDALGVHTGGYRRIPPVLAVEVAGGEEGEAELREKAAWYRAHGVLVVWLVLPDRREVVVLTPEAEARCSTGELLPKHPSLPGLQPVVDDLFRELA